MTCKLNRNDASRYIDQSRNLCAMPLAGCAPADLLDHEAVEIAREAAEGVRVAYVAATRARDVLVVPAIGDCEYEGWVGTLNTAIIRPPPNAAIRSPPPAVRRSATTQCAPARTATHRERTPCAQVCSRCRQRSG